MDTDEFKDLMSIAECEHPDMDKWVLEGLILMYLDGKINDKGDILTDEVNEVIVDTKDDLKPMVEALQVPETVA